MTTRALAVMVCLTASSALAQDNSNSVVAELFLDRGDTFARAGSKQGLKVGSTVQVLGPTIGDTQERRTVGSATVMEVWDNLARLNLDAAAQKEGGAKFVRVTKGALARPKASAVAQPTAATPGTDEAPEPESKRPRLKGRAGVSGPRVIVYNDSHLTWTNCDVRLPSNKRYVIGALPPNESEGIMPFRFVQDGIPRDLPTTWVNVKCEEGESRFQVR